jgi:hypothetical protein
MSNNQMPKFDFSTSSVKTTEELEALDPKRTESKYFRPGKHEVVISDVEYRGVAKGDTNWGSLALTYEGTGGKTIKEFVLIPFKDITYGEKKTTYPFRKLQDLVSALGLDLTPETLPNVMQTLFANPDSLKGLNIAVDIGYQNAHAKYSKKDADGNSIVTLVKKDGSVLADAAGNAITFADGDSAKAYADQVGMKFDSFVNVLSHAKSVTPNKALGRKTSNGF